MKKNTPIRRGSSRANLTVGHPASEMIAGWRTRRVPLRQPDYKRQTVLADPDPERSGKVRAAASVAFRRILVPTDFSKESRRALKLAAVFATRDGGRLTLLHVLEPVHDLRGQPPERWRADSGMLRFARQRLRVLARKYVPASSQSRLLVHAGAAAHEILKVAQANRSDLIIMPTRGLSRESSLEAGSTAERVVRRARCPVLVLPPRQRPRPKS